MIKFFQDNEDNDWMISTEEISHVESYAVHSCAVYMKNGKKVYISLTVKDLYDTLNERRKLEGRHI